MRKKSLNRRLVLTLAWVLAFWVGNGTVSWAAKLPQLTVFAAASTTNAVTDVGKLFAQNKLGQVVTSFASSSTLAEQIAKGAPAAVYISANEKWMNYLAKQKQIVQSTRFDLLGNELVLIAPSTSKLQQVAIAPHFDLKKLLEGGRLAMGNPDYVPAGIYGRQALQQLGVWQQVEGQVARARDVRAALALVGRGEAPLGIVYSTDAAITNQVKVVGTFPADSHPPIVYPAAIVAGHETPVAKRFLEFLKTPAAKAIFQKYGFTVR